MNIGSILKGAECEPILAAVRVFVPPWLTFRLDLASPPGYGPTIMTSLKGQFLIASPQLTEPNFAQSVLLMIHHDASGAMGVIINREMNVTVAQACDQFTDDIDANALESLTDQMLFHGGPCETMLIALHDGGPVGGTEVLSGVFVSTEKDEVEKILNNPFISAKYIVGYAGWAAGQLEGEFATGSWRVAPASSARVLKTDTNLWDRLQAEMSLQQWVPIERIPEDPSVN